MRNKLAKNSIAVGLVTLIVTAGLSFSAQADNAGGAVAFAESSAITATGLTGIIDSDICVAKSPTGTPVPEGTGVCGVGLGASQPAVTSFDQTASTDLAGSNGRSTADAAVAGTGIDALTTIDLSGISSADLGGIDTGTVLDPLILGLNGIVRTALDTALGLLGITLDELLADIQDAAIAPITAALQDAIPVSAVIGAVTSTCDATAGSATTGNGTVAGMDITVELGGGNDIIIPITLGTDPNSALIGEVAPQQLVDGLVDGLEATLTLSLNNALGPLAVALGDVQTQLIDPVLAQVGPALLAPVGDALTPLVEGTVNKQETLPDGAREFTALELNVGTSVATLDLARTKCGPNTAVVVADDTPADDTPADDTPADDTPSVDADAAADADSQADADVTTTLPATGSPNLLPFWMLGLGLLLFGATVLLNEKRRLQI